MTEFSITIDSKELSRGLRPSKRMPRNSKLLVECTGAVGRDEVLQILDELTRMDTDFASEGFDPLPPFPFPQIFGFVNLIIVCTQTVIYEWIDSALVEKLDIEEDNSGSTWCAVDFHEFVYMSNARVAVVRSVLTGAYSITTDQPVAMSMCDYHGQVLICGLDGDIIPDSYWAEGFPGWQEPVIPEGNGEY